MSISLQNYRKYAKNLSFPLTVLPFLVQYVCNMNFKGNNLKMYFSSTTYFTFILMYFIPIYIYLCVFITCLLQFHRIKMKLLIFKIQELLLQETWSNLTRIGQNPCTLDTSLEIYPKNVRISTLTNYYCSYLLFPLWHFDLQNEIPIYVLN